MTSNWNKKTGHGWVVFSLKSQYSIFFKLSTPCIADNYFHGPCSSSNTFSDMVLSWRVLKHWARYDLRKHNRWSPCWIAPWYPGHSDSAVMVIKFAYCVHSMGYTSLCMDCWIANLMNMGEITWAIHQWLSKAQRYYVNISSDSRTSIHWAVRHFTSRYHWIFILHDGVLKWFHLSAIRYKLRTRMLRDVVLRHHIRTGYILIKLFSEKLLKQLRL